VSFSNVSACRSGIRYSDWGAGWGADLPIFRRGYQRRRRVAIEEVVIRRIRAHDSDRLSPDCEVAVAAGRVCRRRAAPAKEDQTTVPWMMAPTAAPPKGARRRPPKGVVRGAGARAASSCRTTMPLPSRPTSTTTSVAASPSPVAEVGNFFFKWTGRRIN
jgi:hypothetical protein